MRIKRGVTTRRRHKKILKMAKGYRWGRSKVFRLAKNAVAKAGMHAYAHRRTKKRDFRRLWITRISAAVKQLGLNYSQFQHGLTKNMVILNRKVLSNLAIEHPQVFETIVKKVTK